MRSLFLFALGALTGVAHAEIVYHVDVLPKSQMLRVKMEIPNTEKGAKLQIPNWAPGAYILRDNFNSVQNLRAYDQDGNPLKIESTMTTSPRRYEEAGEMKTAENQVKTWSVQPAKTTRIQYDIAMRIVDGAVHWSGPSTYMYEVNRLREKCRLTVSPPDGWPVFVGLDEVLPGTRIYTAKDYDVLADNPVTTGDVLLDTYTIRGKPHQIVMRGAAKTQVDRAYLKKACDFITRSQVDFFEGSMPYNKYVWHFAVNPGADGAGGLEHLSSTQITMAAGVGQRVVHVIAHEFFHLWNVKRIRSKVLGPFDYTRLPDTGAIWWLEGVTDYYSSLLQYRYGWWDEKTLFADAVRNLNAVRRNPAHMTVSPHDSSLRMPEASRGRGNSQGYQISYYNNGWVAGMVLDLALRKKTDGRRSLDDVELALWAMTTEDGPGFEEDEIRKQYLRFGGAEMAEFYDSVIMRGGKMSFEETLAAAGLMAGEIEEAYVDLGFEWASGQGATRPGVTAVRSHASSALRVGDQIISVNGKAITGQGGRALNQAMTEATRGAEAGKALALEVQRGDQTLQFAVSPVNSTRKTFGIGRNPNATVAEKAIADGWLAQRKI